MIECLVLPSAGYRLISLVGAIKYLQEIKYYERKNIKDIYGVSAGSWLGTIVCLTENWDDLVDYVINRPYNKIYKYENCNYGLLFSTSIFISVVLYLFCYIFFYICF